ncbi:MAG: NlpC/P60 family protein [Coriobacteriia bacterium]|nr:NlpC/P60 family protein [Coriobacteriia bacterium]
MRLKAIARRSGALALVSVLLLATPAVAAPSSSTTGTPTPPPASPAPAPAPAPDRTPLRTPPADTPAPIDVPVDEETREFREELARRQAALDEFLAQLDALDRELALAAEAYNAAVDKLEATKVKVIRTEQSLEDATAAYAFQSELLEGRATSIYKEGTFSTIEVLLGSKSLTDFLERVKFLNTIGLADAEVAKALKAQRDLVEKAAEELKGSQTKAEALEFELKARQIEVMLRIQERQEMLANAQLELLELLDEQAARRQGEEAVLLRSILSGANEAGIVITPGSPVETAFAYHGVPYLWGGESPAGMDCSGLVLYVYRQHGVELPHYSGSQFLMGQKVAPAGLQPGDAVFFGSPIYHVGLYVGGGYFIHAPRTGDFVKISPLAARKDYAGARRYNWVPRVGSPVGGRADFTDPLATIR